MEQSLNNITTGGVGGGYGEINGDNDRGALNGREVGTEKNMGAVWREVREERNQLREVREEVLLLQRLVSAVNPLLASMVKGVKKIMEDLENTSPLEQGAHIFGVPEGEAGIVTCDGNSTYAHTIGAVLEGKGLLLGVYNPTSKKALLWSSLNINGTFPIKSVKYIHLEGSKIMYISQAISKMTNGDQDILRFYLFGLVNEGDDMLLDELKVILELIVRIKGCIVYMNFEKNLLGKTFAICACNGKVFWDFNPDALVYPRENEKNEEI